MATRSPILALTPLEPRAFARLACSLALSLALHSKAPALPGPATSLHSPPPPPPPPHPPPPSLYPTPPRQSGVIGANLHTKPLIADGYEASIRATRAGQAHWPVGTRGMAVKVREGGCLPFATTLKGGRRGWPGSVECVHWPRCHAPPYRRSHSGEPALTRPDDADRPAACCDGAQRAQVCQTWVCLR